jgi:hypothetical protein
MIIFNYNLSCIKQIAGFSGVNSKQYRFTLLNGSRGLHISESMVSISYMFR